MTLLAKHRAFFLPSPAHGLPFAWRWKNFRFEELESRDGAGLLLVPEQLDRLQALRDLIGVPLIVNSHYRSFAHNMNVGGSKASWHMSGAATDCSAKGYTPARLGEAARSVGFSGIGIYATFTHVDIGPVRQWAG